MSCKADLSTVNLLKGVVFDYERLNYEEERNKTFANWPVYYPVDPPRLAKAGFYFTGFGDEVECFSCHGRIKNWNFGDIVLKKHSELYPHCDFIRNLSNNIPLLKNFFVPDSADIKKSSDAMQFDIDYEKMKCEKERMKTFTKKWPLSNESITDIVQAGYFYTGAIDRIQCAFCKIIVVNLQASTPPYSRSLRHLPQCAYISDKSRNRRAKVNDEKVPWYKISSQDVCGNVKPTHSSFVNISLENKLINNMYNDYAIKDFRVFVYRKSYHPQYASFMARIETFNSWPVNAPVSKDDLAVAGFYYLGVDDRTACFCCNGGLKSWEAGDDPWIEHARWFSDCQYLRLSKDDGFIIDCLLKSASVFLNENDDAVNDTDVSRSLIKKLDEAWSSKLVRNLAESGIYPSYVLKSAILLQIRQTGSSFSNNDDLCMAASYLKDKMEQHYSNKQSVNIEDLNIQLSRHSTVSGTSEESNEMEHVPSCSTSGENNLNKGRSAGSYEVMYLQKEDQNLCKICMDKELGVVFLPCGHLPACTICAPALKNCPLCRRQIQATVRCYFQ